MIDSTHRFHGHNSLRFAYQRGQTQRGAVGALKYVTNNRRTTYRLAVVVSRKVSKSAVVRNRIRRRIYEIVRSVATDITQPYDLVLVVHSEQSATIPAVQLKESVLQLLVRGQVIPETSL